MSDLILGELGLLSEVRGLRQCIERERELRDAFTAAKEALDSNVNAAEKIRAKLGAHTKAVGHAELVRLDDMMAYIPVPNSSWSSTSTMIQVEFMLPKGERKSKDGAAATALPTEVK